MKDIESYLKPDRCGIELERKIITNIKYYVAMMAGIELTGGTKDIATKLSNLPSILISDEVLKTSFENVLDKYNKLGATDQVAKGSDLRAQLLS